jgi:hypothetical protein
LQEGGNRSVDTAINVPANTTVTTLIPFAVGLSRDTVGMRGFPRSKFITPSILSPSPFITQPFNTANIDVVEVYMASPTRVNSAVIDAITAVPVSNSFTAMVNRYGQIKNTPPTRLIDSDQELQQTVSRDTAQLQAMPKFSDWNTYGGWSSGPTLTATGFYRTEKVNGKWWIVDPAGKLFLSMGVNHIGLEMGQTFTTNREFLFAELPSKTGEFAQFYSTKTAFSGPVSTGEVFNLYGANLYRKYGSIYDTAWTLSSARRMDAWGFNTIGNWSNYSRFSNRPYVVSFTPSSSVSFIRFTTPSNLWGPMYDPYDPNFLASMRARATSLISPTMANDPYMVGYYIDNELAWGRTDSTTAARYNLAFGVLDETLASSPAKQAFKAQLQAKYVTVAALNAAWGTVFASWSSIDSPYTAQQQTDFRDFATAFATQFMNVANTAIAERDPNHMTLGVRMCCKPPQEVVDAIAAQVDVNSYNNYFLPGQIPEYTIQTFDGPIIISEIHYGAFEAGSLHGGLAQVYSQEQRANSYQQLIEQEVIQKNNVVGVHWFQWSDQPLTGRYYDGENYTIGLVDITDQPYVELTERMRSVHGTLYQNRYGN